jgi:metal-sulfur cluster biosynthetic enzyme
MEKEIYKALRQVIDPEVGFDVVSLGLIRNIKVENGKVHIVMTLSSPQCPISDVILGWVKESVMNVNGVQDVDIELTFNPPWSIEMASEDVKKVLGI